MIKKFFSSIALITMTSLTNLSLAQLFSNVSKITLLAKDQIFHAPRMFLRFAVSAQEQDDYCFCACVQAIFRHFRIINENNQAQFSQSSIYQQLTTNNLGILRSVDHSMWINRQLQMNNIITNYHRTIMPQNFGMMYTDMRMFETFIISSLRQNAPVILEYQVDNAGDGHAVIINGIEPDRNEDQTIYYYQDPARTEEGQLTFRANQIRTFFNNGPGYILGVNSNFDFSDRSVTIRLADEIFLGSLQDQQIQLNSQRVNLTQQAGITEFSELLRFGIIELSEFSVKTNWFDIDFHFQGEVLIPRYISEDLAIFRKRQESSWNEKYKNFARGQFDTYYRVKTWKDDDGDFYMNIIYKFFAKVLLTTTLIDIEISLGKLWVMKY